MVFQGPAIPGLGPLPNNLLYLHVVSCKPPRFKQVLTVRLVPAVHDKYGHFLNAFWLKNSERSTFFGKSFAR